MKDFSKGEGHVIDTCSRSLLVVATLSISFLQQVLFLVGKVRRVRASRVHVKVGFATRAEVSSRAVADERKRVLLLRRYTNSIVHYSFGCSSEVLCTFRHPSALVTSLLVVFEVTQRLVNSKS